MTKIEWVKNADGSEGKSWNPIRARRKDGGKVGWYCQKKSPGCKNCYAERMNLRVSDDGTGIGNGVTYTEGSLAFVEVFLDEQTLLAPLHWKKPRTVFVCSQTDLFGSWVPDEWLDKIYAIEALCPQHTFIHVTKRPERRLEYLLAIQNDDKDMHRWGGAACEITDSPCACLKVEDSDWPLANVRELVTVCNQEEADALIPILLQTPAACRGVSIEPMLGPTDLRDIQAQLPGGAEQWDALDRREAADAAAEGCCGAVLDWVICGGESGPGARPMHPDWARSLRDQCQAAGVPFFFKQWGEYTPYYESADEQTLTIVTREFPNGGMARVGKKLAGRLLDGREWNEVPEVTRG